MSFKGAPGHGFLLSMWRWHPAFESVKSPQ